MNGRSAGGAQQDVARPNGGDDFEEISLADIVRVLHKRRILLASAIVLSLVAGGALTVFTTPQFEAEVSLIPLSQGEIIRNWLQSRAAASLAAEDVGAALNPILFPDGWDPGTQSWRIAEPSGTEVALRLQERVTVSSTAAARAASSGITVTVVLEDPTLARDVAAAYIGGLAELRPQLEELERAELFDKYYDGTNEQEAQRKAETAAKQKEYWLVFDEPTVPKEPVKPRPVLYMALAAVLGVMAGVMAVFGYEWVSKFRTEFDRVAPPPP